MRQGIELGKIKLIVFKKLSRLGRSASELFSFYELCENQGCHLVSLDENLQFDTRNATGKMVRGFLTVISEFQRDFIVEQMLSGLNFKRQKGEVLKKPGWSYKFNKDGNGKWKLPPYPDRELEQVFLEMVSRYLYQSQKLLQIQDWLNARGVKPPRGSKWSPAGISFVLTNPIQTGKYILDLNAYEPLGKRKESIIECEALITEDVQQKIKEKLAAHNKRVSEIRI